MSNTAVTILMFAVSIILMLADKPNADLWAVGGWIIYAMGNKND
jgi:hypothetical protein